ncbi:DNA-3-methyladenine glycosylase I [Coralloluteibacterium stylophorae]|uniref:DNA-3-methyladenine glycosylase I n=1 Tax=Coralloluteibacterium stylophorae TaxID=1776034 RepID=A0A8J7VVR0_9GAMM|nr:DNA-3-methyladenine glycosylase I [Coralloluteibacterium stylophorae]MBS7456081.1 DNA-3-methyladenine glycosylase I [Coralloluteibacterium stylophorae]
MSGYCDSAPGHPVHAPYHDHEYGFPIDDDAALFERLVLEINQAGLSWLTILNKRAAFRAAYDGFDIATVARYGDADRARLLADAGIIRNRLKVDAAIHNAGVLEALVGEYGSLRAWLDDEAARHGVDRTAWTRAFKRRLKFMGGEIVGEFLMSTGYLPGAHREDCPVHARILAASPAWRRATAGA